MLLAVDERSDTQTDGVLIFLVLIFFLYDKLSCLLWCFITRLIRSNSSTSIFFFLGVGGVGLGVTGPFVFKHSLLCVEGVCAAFRSETFELPAFVYTLG